MIAIVRPAEFVTRAISPALKRIHMWSVAAEELLLGTAIHESMGFKYRRQLHGGPARGFFQMEPATHNDIWANYLAYRKPLAKMVGSLLSSQNTDKIAELERNDLYAAAMARLEYARAVAPLPAAGDLNAQALYWKRYYNTPLGMGTPAQYIADWNAMMSAPSSATK